MTPSAMACTLGTAVQGVAPADGAVDVPTNAQLMVFFSHTDDWLNLALARTSDGTIVPATVAIRPGGNIEDKIHAVAVLVPTSSLDEGVEYTLTMSADDLLTGDNGASSQTTSFTVGAQQDSTSPEYSGISTVTWTDLLDESTAGEDCTSGPPRWSFDVGGNAPATDIDGLLLSPDVVAYAVYRQGFALATGPTPRVQYQTFPENLPSEVCLTLRAIDQSGNVDQNSESKCFTIPDPNADTGTDTADTDSGTDTGPLPPRGDTGFPRQDTGYWGGGWEQERPLGCQGMVFRICGTQGSGPMGTLPILFALLWFRRRA